MAWVTPLDGIPNTRRDDAPHMLTARAQRTIEAIDGRTLDEMRALRDETERFMLRYKFGMDEVITKLSILREEFNQTHDYNPIEHISSRLKSLDSVIAKMQRKGIEPTFDTIRETVTDIAGVRVTCSFVSDAYRLAELLTAQRDIRVMKVKDYIAEPKENGYQSLHLIVEVPVFLYNGAHPVAVEVQIRTIAMDFWASLEHKIYYKYDRQVPQELLDGLTDAAHTAAELDARMERPTARCTAPRPTSVGASRSERGCRILGVGAGDRAGPTRSGERREGGAPGIGDAKRAIAGHPRRPSLDEHGLEQVRAEAARHVRATLRPVEAAAHGRATPVGPDLVDAQSSGERARPPRRAGRARPRRPRAVRSRPRRRARRRCGGPRDRPCGRSRIVPRRAGRPSRTAGTSRPGAGARCAGGPPPRRRPRDPRARSSDAGQGAGRPPIPPRRAARGARWPSAASPRRSPRVARRQRPPVEQRHEHGGTRRLSHEAGGGREVGVAVHGSTIRRA